MTSSDKWWMAAILVMAGFIVFFGVGIYRHHKGMAGRVYHVELFSPEGKTAKTWTCKRVSQGRDGWRLLDEDGNEIGVTGVVVSTRIK